MAEYRVRYEIDITANSAEEAAKQVAAWHSDTALTSVYEVTDARTLGEYPERCELIDLGEGQWA